MILDIVGGGDNFCCDRPTVVGREGTKSKILDHFGLQ
jgi:hypothetical protein